MELRETLIGMRKLLTPEGAWTQGTLSRNSKGKYTETINEGVSFCLAGASLYYAGCFFQWSDVVLNFIQDRLPYPCTMGGSIIAWNDDPDRTQAEVLALLDKCIAELDPPINPNAETIAALEAAERGEFSGSFDMVEELMAHLNSDCELEDA